MVGYITSATATATSLTYPAGIVSGDLILYFGFRTATTAPTLPSGFTSIKTNSGDASSMTLCRATAVGTESGTSSPTFTNATQVMVVIYRGVTAIGVSTSHETTTSPGQLTTSALVNLTGNSWVVGFCGSKQGTSQTVGGWTNRAELKNGTTSMIDCWDTNGGVGAFSSTNVTLGTSTDTQSAVVELEGGAYIVNGVSVLQSTSAFTFSVASLTTSAFPNAVTAGNTIVALVWAGTNASDVSGVTDTGSNSYSQIFQIDDTGSSGTDFEVWVAHATTGGSSFTVSATDSGSNIWWIVAYEVSGLVSSSWLDKSGHTFQDTSGTAGAIALSSSTTVPDLLLQVSFAAGLSTTNLYMPNNGWWNLVTHYDYTDVSAKGFAFATQIQSVATPGTYSITPNFQGTATAEFDSIMVALKLLPPNGYDVTDLNNNLGANVVQMAVRRGGYY